MSKLIKDVVEITHIVSFVDKSPQRITAYQEISEKLLVKIITVIEKEQ